MPPLDRLEVISPSGDIKFYELDPAHGVTNIGRHPDNDVVIDSPAVAPFHAVLYHQQKPYQLIFIGEAKGRALTLSNVDTLQVDGYALLLLEGEPADTITPRASALPAVPAPAVEREPVHGLAPVEASAPVPAQPPSGASQAGGLAVGLIPNRRDEVVLAEFSSREFTLEVDQTASCNVSLTNGGDIVATFVVTVLGLDDRWVSITPPEVNLNEGQTGTAIVTITPPRKPSSLAGLHHFGIVVSSPDYPGRVSQAAATLVIQPYFEYGLSDLSPKQQNIPYGKRLGSAAFSLTNTGNSEVKFQVQAVEDARACQFEFQVQESEAPQARQIEVSVPPEATQPVKLTMAPLKRLFFGMQGVPYAYSVQVTPLGTTLSPRSVLGQAQSLPLIGPIHVAILLVMLAILAVIIFRPRISAFAAAPNKVLSSEIMAGKKVSLSWNVSWLTTVTIDQQVGQMKGTVGAVDIAPQKTTTYRLTATNLISALIPAFAATREQTVIVDPVEPIVRLAVDKDRVIEGETVAVSWEVLNANEVVLKINGTPETLPTEQHTGRRDLTPKGEMTVSIEARNLYTTGNGVVQTRVINGVKPTATPLPLPVIAMFNVPAGPVVAGDTVTLEWSVTGVDKITIEPLGEFPPSGKTIDKPATTTQYQLVASNGQDEVRSLRELVVMPPPTATPVPGTPKIDVLTATPNEVALGSADATSIQLTWAVSGDYTSIELSGETIGRVSGLSPRGTRIVSAGNKDTDFVLTAQNGDLEAAQSITVKVVAPVPAISNLSPSSIVAGGTSSLVLTVNGASFVEGATVQWDGSDRPTVFVSNSVLRADIPSSDTATKGKFAITVFNPAKSGGGVSNKMTFVVYNPTPILTDLTAYSTTVGLGTDIIIGLLGSGFVADSRVLWSGLSLETTFGDQNNLTAIIPAARTAVAGEYIISVTNPDGGSSAGKTFVVGNPVPKITSVSPSSQPVQPLPTTNVDLTISGSGFMANSTVSWNGALLTNIVLKSSTELMVTVPAAYFATVGPVAISVINPAPRGGPSAPFSPPFYVNKIPTTIALTYIYPSPSAVSGQPVTVIATLSYAAGIPNLPEGTVTFKNGTTVLDVINIATNQTATLNRRFSAITMNLQAVYNGDNNFASSTSAAVPYWILPATPQVNISSPSVSTYGQAAQFSAAVTALSPGSDTPSYPCGGSIEFFVNALSVGSVPYCGGYSSLPVSNPALLTAGAHSVTALYHHGSDVNFVDSALSAAIQHTVNRLAPDVLVVVDPGPTSDYGNSLVLTATVSSSAGAPTGGTVAFTAVPASGPTISLGSAPLAGGQASIAPADIFVTGSYNFDAVFTSSDPNFDPGSGATVQTVKPILPGSITLNCGRLLIPPSSALALATVAVTAPATPPGLSYPTGTVSLTYQRGSGSSQSANLTLPGDAANTVTWTDAYTGTVTVRASYVPNSASNYLAGPATDISGRDTDLTSCIIPSYP